MLTDEEGIVLFAISENARPTWKLSQNKKCGLATDERRCTQIRISHKIVLLSVYILYSSVANSCFETFAYHEDTKVARRHPWKGGPSSASPLCLRRQLAFSKFV